MKRIQTHAENTNSAQRPFIKNSKRVSGLEFASQQQPISCQIGPLSSLIRGSSQPSEEGRLRVLIHVFPLGVVKDPAGNKRNITEEQLDQALANWETYISRGATVRLNYHHRWITDKGAGVFERFFKKESGLWGEALLTPAASKGVLEGEYTRFSPEWYWKGYEDDTFGDYEGLFLYGGALTDDEHFKTALEGIFIMEEDSLKKVASATGKSSKNKEKNAMEEFLAEHTGSKDPEKQKEILKERLDRAKSAEELEKEKAALAEENEKLKSENSEMKEAAAVKEAEEKEKAARREYEDLVQGAFRDSKITEAQRKAFIDPEQSPFADAEGFKKYLATAGNAVPKAAGSEAGAPETAEASSEDKESAAKLGISIEEYQRLSKGELKKEGE